MVAFYQLAENISLTVLTGDAEAQQRFCIFTAILKLAMSGRRIVELPPLYNCTKIK